MQPKKYKNANDLLVSRSFEVMAELDLDLSNRPTSLSATYLRTNRGTTLSINDVKKKIFELGYGESNEINYRFIDAVYRQICYNLKFNG